MRIAVLSFADIDNFGDTFFPFVVKQELLKRMPGAQIDMVTLTGRKIGGMEFEKFSLDRLEGNYEAIILAGGEVIHDYDEKTWNPIFQRLAIPLDTDKPSDIVFGWSGLKIKFKAWFSVGVRILAASAETKVSNALRQLDYVSVRGLLSKKNIEISKDSYFDKIHITPDLGWFFPRHLANVNDNTSKMKFKGKDYFIFQTNSIAIDDAAEIFNTLRRFKEHSGLTPVLLPIIKPWEDFKYLQLIKDFDREGLLELLPNDLDLWQIGNLLLGSKFVVSSSLHAATTALAAKLPAAIINKWQGTKLQEFWGHQMRIELLRSDYSCLDRVLLGLSNYSPTEFRLTEQYAEYMQMMLDFSFDILTEQILDSGAIQ